ncbi:transposase [Actinoplanes xinjiangensis]|uniref:transposase n=1 Tax=Actinoplanes xinjiangensis TaxID=512350 RepID=UPI003F4E1AEC
MEHERRFPSDPTDEQWEIVEPMLPLIKSPGRIPKHQVTERIVEELREQLRPAEGREAEPAAGVMDSQSVQAADAVGRDTRGHDAGKKINGRKRFIVTDTLGLPIVVCVMSASRQDRDGAKTSVIPQCPRH